MKSKILAWIGIFILCNKASTQNIASDSIRALAALDSLEKKANYYSENHPIEKVYVHFDKPFYILGEISWYKAYVVNGSDLNTTEISGVLNLDWIDPSGKIIIHQRLKIENSGAAGSFIIDTALHEGTYRVRAYTNWMRNEDQELFFWKKIQILSPALKKSKLPGNIIQSKIDLQFFPEGGTLVAGIMTQIAFKAIGVNGKGIDIKGQIVDEENNFITGFQSVHNGMGTLPLIAYPNKSYRAILQSGEIYPLSIPSAKGLVLAVSNMNANKIYVRVQSSEEYRSGPIYLVGHARGSICYAAYIKMDSSFKDISIAKDSLPEGVLQLTLFDSKSIPQCERMLFIKKDDRMIATIKSDKEQWAARDSVILNFKIDSIKGNTEETSLSVSVTDAGFINTDRNIENIYTRLLLQSDIKGYVEDPGWYFDSSTAAKTHALDLVMLTHGWSRYNWEKILSPKEEPISFIPEKGITLEGKMIANNKPAANAPFMLTFSDSGNNNMGIYETDSLGHFIIPDLDFNDSTLLSFRIMNKKGIIQNAKIHLITKQNIPQLIPYQTGEGSNNLSENLTARIIKTGLWNPDKYKMLEEVIVKSQTNKIRTVGMGAMLVKPDADDLKARIPVSQFVGRYAMALPFYGYRTMPGGTEVWRKSRIFIDGFEAEATGFAGNPYFILNSVSIEDIEQIIVGGNAHDGYGIAIMTKRISSQEITGTIKQMVKGYDAAREFYHPKYETPNISTTPDNRITLYWNPNLQIDKDGNATIKFYNTDAAQKLLITIEGIVNGHAISTSQAVGKTDSFEKK